LLHFPHEFEANCPIDYSELETVKPRVSSGPLAADTPSHVARLPG